MKEKVNKFCLQCNEDMTFLHHSQRKFCSSQCKRLFVVISKNKEWASSNEKEKTPHTVSYGEYLSREHCAKKYTFFFKKFNGVRG